jgi:hypothetical protein
MTETIEIEQEITEKVLSHVSEAYGGFSTAEKAAEELVAKAKARLVEAAIGKFRSPREPISF